MYLRYSVYRLNFGNRLHIMLSDIFRCFAPNTPQFHLKSPGPDWISIVTFRVMLAKPHFRTQYALTPSGLWWWRRRIARHTIRLLAAMSETLSHLSFPRPWAIKCQSKATLIHVCQSELDVFLRATIWECGRLLLWFTPILHIAFPMLCEFWLSIYIFIDITYLSKLSLTQLNRHPIFRSF